jgi:hypothetical protein
MIMRSLLACLSVVVLAGITLASRPAHACSCSRQGVVISPGARDPAPLNAQVRVSWPRGLIRLEASTVSLQVADKKAPKPVAAKRVSVGAGAMVIVILTPDAPLEPKTRYEIIGAESPGGKKATLAGFKTGSDPDTAAPTWKGPGPAAYQVSDPLVCGTGKHHAEVPLGTSALADDKTPPTSIALGVWSADGEFDARQPPITLIPSWGDRAVLGTASKCMAANFDIPEWPLAGDDFHEVKLRLAPVDLAGNVGTPSVITVTNVPPAPPKARPAGKKP